MRLVLVFALLISATSFAESGFPKSTPKQTAPSPTPKEDSIVPETAKRKTHFRAEMKELAREISIAAGSSIDHDLSLALDAAQRGSEAEVIMHGSQFLRSKNSKSSPLLNSVNLLLGQAHYGTGQYEEALHDLNTIPHGAPEFAPAQSVLAWTFLMRHTPTETIRVARELIEGGTKDRFTPDANVAVTFALMDSCHFIEAMASIRHFRMSYETTYRWLTQWKKQGAPDGKTLSDVIAGDKSSIPQPLLNEWKLARPSDLETKTSFMHSVLMDDSTNLRALEATIYESQGRVPAEKIPATQNFLKGDLSDRCHGNKKKK